MTDPLREFIGCDADYELFRNIEILAMEELRPGPARSRILNVYDVNILLRLIRRLADGK